jgi:hypothetical protein
LWQASKPVHSDTCPPPKTVFSVVGGLRCGAVGGAHHLGLLGDELLGGHGVRVRPDLLGVAENGVTLISWAADVSCGQLLFPFEQWLGPQFWLLYSATLTERVERAADEGTHDQS